MRIVLLVEMLAAASVASAAEWPQFRGPKGDGVAATANLPTEWSETENVRWKVETPGRGWSSPIVADGLIWITTAVERSLDKKQQEELRAGKFGKNPMKAELSIVGEISLRLLGFDAETGDAVDIETLERGAEVLALGEDGPPAQAGLKSLERQLLEQALVVRDRKSPLGVVIRQEFRCGSAPAATRLAIFSHDGFDHAQEFAPGAMNAPLPFWRGRCSSIVGRRRPVAVDRVQRGNQ